MAARSIWAMGGTMVELRPWRLALARPAPARAGGAGGAALRRDRRAVAARHGPVAERHQPGARAGIQDARRQGGRAVDQLPRRLARAVGVDRRRGSARWPGTSNLPVIAFIEDVGASGGYWLALAADEIFAAASSIVGSIGVVHASFGFADVIERLGIERRLYTAGAKKSMLDPFRPQDPEDVDRLTGDHDRDSQRLQRHGPTATRRSAARGGRRTVRGPDLDRAQGRGTRRDRWPGRSPRRSCASVSGTRSSCRRSVRRGRGGGAGSASGGATTEARAMADAVLDAIVERCCGPATGWASRAVPACSPRPPRLECRDRDAHLLAAAFGRRSDH